MQLNYRDILSMPEEKALLVINHSLSENLPLKCIVIGKNLKVIYHPLYGMDNYVLIWGDWLSCDPLRGSHDSQSPHIRNTCAPSCGNSALFVTKLFILCKG